MKSQLENLYRRSGITKESCFQAGRRLDLHNTLSLWSLTTLAFSLIVVSLITQIYGANKFVEEYSRFLNISMTVLSILALIISVVVQKSDFSLKADKFRRQAMDINELRISFKHLIDNNDQTTDDLRKLYEDKSKNYSEILERNLIHDQIDYNVSNTQGIEHTYYYIKMIITEFLGYWIIIALALFVLSWASINTYFVSIETQNQNTISSL
ncbi:MAG: SLATT domain-containing protein [Candidatus Thiothrix putei]|uniref:SLATT domain-containing protein n=1 Tax=Candidatus Thiothrix putei TaxID=3080811 RepID=A0AA95HAW8_9GAMM|nr:MAG: SLATT domain-containing protein [Candidatus Thiothrix putei]